MKKIIALVIAMVISVMALSACQTVSDKSLDNMLDNSNNGGIGSKFERSMNNSNSGTYKSGQTSNVLSTQISTVVNQSSKTSKSTTTSSNNSVNNNMSSFSNSTINSINNSSNTSSVKASSNSSATNSSSNNTLEGVKFAVDKSYSGTDGATISGAYTYKTITACLSGIVSKNLSSETNKIVNISNGDYVEKLSIPSTLKNVKMIGATNGNVSISYGDYSSKNDMGTDATATVTVLGEGFEAYNISFVNSFDYLKASSSINRQALAMLVNADKVVFQDCEFWGHQDTLETIYGRQYFKNCLIAGSTDFIFCYNSATLFEGCEIRTRNRNDSNGGYIVAAKGNDGTNGSKIPKFGYVFNNCKLTFESGVKSASVALARPWRTNAVVTYMNCEMGVHISKKPCDNKTSLRRYVTMKGAGIVNLPKDANFSEYNNTGSGAISASEYASSPSVDFVMLSSVQAAEYIPSNIFAIKNGAVNYSGVWNPVK